MKKMKGIIVIFLTISFAILTSCTKVKLSNNEAERLVKSSLNLPMLCEAAFYDSDCRPLISQGILLGNDLYNLQVSEEYKKYFSQKLERKGRYPMSQYRFKAYDIDLDAITGLSVDKESETAIVRFSLKVANATPFVNNARFFAIRNFESDVSENINTNSKFNGELRFRKFDTGWQLESSPSQGYSSILESIVNPWIFQ